MTKEEVKKEIIKALCNLSNVDCNTKDERQKTINAKKVHETYNLLDDLKNKILGGTED